MNLLNDGISRISAVMLVCALFCFALFAQAAPAAPAASAPPFDHSRTGFILKDVHLTLKCEQCHVDGIFKNTPKVCSGCHTLGTRVASKPKPINHVPTTAECDSCHISTTSFLVNSYKHVGVTGNCKSCHNGMYLGVKGQPQVHIPTLQPCETCHTNTSTFVSWRMDHTGMTSDCFNCHGGPAGEPGIVGTYPSVTSFNPFTHLPMQTPPQDCSACHIGFVSFLGATFRHTSTTAACSTCHSGQLVGVVSINPSIHTPLPSGTTCDTCHTNVLTGLPYSLSPTFLGVTFHQTALGSGTTAPAGMTCATCHSGAYISQNAMGKGTTHIPTTADCVTCHTQTNTLSYQSFLGATFSHVGIGAGTCGTCHQGQYGSIVSINPAIHIPQSSGNACDACHTNAITGLPGAATPTFLGVVFHQNTLGNPPTGKCSTCHSGAYLSENALAKNLGHVATTADCGTCHINTASYTTFLGASFSHSPGTYAAFPTAPPATPLCSSCHNGTTATGKVPTHVATTGDCLACHTNTTTGCPSCTSFYGVQYDHTNATTGVAAYTVFPTAGSVASPRCDSCHGSTALGKTSNHIPTTADCVTCHTPSNTGCGTTGLCTTFLNATFSHVGIAAGTCGTCHQGQYPSVVSINTAVHIPQSSGNACDACHTNTITGLPGSVAPTFLGVIFHQNSLGNPPAGTCTSCHSGTYVSQNAQTKNTGHVVTTADCVACHTATNTTGYTTFLGSTFSHAGIAAGTCGTCHQGQYPGVVSINPAIHIPQSSGNACDACHTNALTGLPGAVTPTFFGVVFHQNTLGNPPTGTCSTCHSGSYLSENALAKNAGHITTTADCVTCHTATNTASYTSFLGANFSHSPGTYATFPTAPPATPLCSSCHNGTTATGKVSTHVATTGDCIACHTNATTTCPSCTTFYGVQYDHTNATTGVAAYTVFPAAGSTASPRCDSCHGSTALGKTSSHVPTTADCITCHTPSNTGCGTTGLCTTFLNATFSHVGIAAGTCGTCHQGQYPGVVSINTAVHIPQSSGNACDACHTNAITGLPASATPTFLNVVFHQNSLGNPPKGTCTSCHSGTYVSQNAQTKNTGHVVTTADCVTCHTATNTLTYTTFLGAVFAHTPGTYATFPSAAPATPLCGSCHGSTALGKNVGHVVTSSDCISCHTNPTTGCPNCSTFLGASGAGPHTTAFLGGKTCVSCHDGTQAVGLSSDALHIPIGSTSCDACHPLYDGAGAIDFSTVATGTLGGGNAGKYAMSHTLVSGTCTSCHSGAYASQGIYGALGKVAKHIPTTITGSLDCTTCHTTFTTPANIKVVSGSADWLAEVMNHNGAQGGAPNYCVTCHLSGVTYLGNMTKKSHNGASTSKDCSNSNCHKPLGKTGRTTGATTSWSWN